MEVPYQEGFNLTCRQLMNYKDGEQRDSEFKERIKGERVKGDRPDQTELFGHLSHSFIEVQFEDVALNLQGFYSAVADLKSRGIEPHWVMASSNLNLGGTDELNIEVLKLLRELDRNLQLSIVHEALGWSSINGHHTYIDLPVPYTEASLELISERVFRVQESLQRKIAIRNIPAQLRFIGAQLTPMEFMYEISRITHCHLVLDEAALEWNGRWLGESTDTQCIEKHLTMRRNLVALGTQNQIRVFTPTEISVENEMTILRVESALEPGSFERQPRQVLMDELTMGFGIRPNADVGIYESESLQPLEQPLLQKSVQQAPQQLVKLGPIKGLNAYNQQYYLQLRNFLKTQFRCVAFMLSGQFDRTAMDYITQYPPSEPFIFHSGRDFEVFLRDSALPERELVSDMARLEWTSFEVSRQVLGPAVDQGVLMELKSDLWDKVGFIMTAHVKLVETSYDVGKVLKLIYKKSKPPESTKPKLSFYLVYQISGGSQIQLIGRPEARAFRFVQAEMNFLKVCQLVSEEEGLSLDEAIQQVFSYVHRWAGLGLVQSLKFRTVFDQPYNNPLYIA